jgi:signal transduction histidine kinase
MKLVNRVSAFFIVALWIVLCGDSLVLYLLIRHYMYSEFDDRLQGALQLLTASIEIEPEDVTWYPAEYALDFDRKMLRDVRWLVADERGRVVDKSSQLSTDSPQDAIVLEYGATAQPREVGTVELDVWRIAQRFVTAATPQRADQREFNEHASLLVTVALARTELDATMRRLGMLLGVLPLALGLIAVVTGRAFVRRSLSPLTAMADQARSTVGPDFETRLPTGSARDELYDLAVAFNRLLDQLQQAFERQRNFTGDAAHQLRTPLTILQGELEVAMRRPRTVVEYRECLTKLTFVIEEMRQIVESLLFLARSDKDAVSPHLTLLALCEWIPQYARRWEEHPRANDFSFQTSGRPCIMASVPLLTQLLDNLIQNAMNYSRPGTPVVLDGRAHGQTVELTVHDQGIGVGEGDRRLVFEPFFRTSEARKLHASGSGLGLTVARRIAEVLGGRLDCHSMPGGGSTFRVELPLCEMAEDEADFRLISR